MSPSDAEAQKAHVIILAAGVGSRLHPITATTPKTLLWVGGKPIIEWQVEGYLAAGIPEENIHVISGHLSDKVKNYLSATFPRVDVVVNERHKDTNNMYSFLLGVRRGVGKAGDGPLIVSNGDCVYSPSLIKKVVEAPHPDVVPAFPGAYLEESMKIAVGEGGAVVHISKDIPPGEAYGTSVDLYKLSPEGARKVVEAAEEVIQKEGEGRWFEVALDKALSRHAFHPLPLSPSHDLWWEVDTKEDLVIANTIFSPLDVGAKEVAVLDLDGTVKIGGKPIDGVPEWIQGKLSKGLKVVFLTNNTSKSREEHKKELSLLFSIPEGGLEVIFPLDSLVAWSRETGKKRFYCLVTSSFRRELEEHGIACVSPNGEIPDVLVGFDKELTYEKLKHASILLSKGARLYLTHIDDYCPTEEGPIPDAGAIAKLLQATTGAGPVQSFGKPNPLLLERILERFPKGKVFIAGDRLTTEGELAKATGVDYVLVLSGATSLEELYTAHRAELEKGHIKAIVRSLPYVDRIGDLKFFLGGGGDGS